MHRRRTLIEPPSTLDWMVAPRTVRHPPLPVIAERGGVQLRTPRATLIVDTREKDPFLFSRFSRWFQSVEYRALPLGDYSVAGLEDSCIVERKSLCDLVQSFTTGRSVFVARLRRMSQAPNRLLVITSALSEVKSRYPYSPADPNRILQSLIAVLVGLNVPFLCADTHQLGAEITASYLYQAHLHHWLDTNGFGRCLSDTDL